MIHYFSKVSKLHNSAREILEAITSYIYLKTLKTFFFFSLKISSFKLDFVSQIFSAVSNFWTL